MATKRTNNAGQTYYESSVRFRLPNGTVQRRWVRGRTRAEHEALIRAEERLHISREVHDVVAHSLSGIIAQADGGQFAAQRDPARAVEVLAGIADTGREALGDVRGLLEMLRDSGVDDEGPDAAGRPPGTMLIRVNWSRLCESASATRRA